MTRESMELWSNDNLSEFSIKFNSVTVVTTSNSPDVMVKMIDECSYKEGYNWDWHFTLSMGSLLSRKQIYLNTGLKSPKTKSSKFRAKIMKVEAPA